jgi:hypothetical protein
MARYYISKKHTLSHDVVGPTSVRVVAAHEGDGSEPVPAGYVSGKFTTESHTPNFSNEKADTPAHGDAESRRWQSLANSTGYSVPYIRNYYRDLLFDVNSGTPDDKAENRRGLLYDASNITSSTDTKKYEDLDPVWAREVARATRRQNIRGARAISALRKDPELAPDQLFTSRPDSLEVDFADFDPRARTLFPTAVSLMSQSVGHPQIVANDDLSEHSSAVAQRAAEKGVVVPHRHNPDMVVTNDMRSKTRTADASLLHNVDRGFGGRIQVSGQGEMGGFSRVPDEDVASARGHLRTMLRGDRPQKAPASPKPNMSQQFLPGMEGFV